MPELPEVETIKLGLQKYIVGKKIVGIEVRLRRIFTGDEKNIIGAKITSIERFGKGLVINLNFYHEFWYGGQMLMSEISVKERSHLSIGELKVVRAYNGSNLVPN